MAIDKSLYQAPQGLEQLAEGEPDIEVEIEDPEAVRISADGEEIFSIEKNGEDENFDENLAEVVSEGELQALAGDLIGDIDNDLAPEKTGRRCTKTALHC